jgi:hypothetical protein
VNHPGAGRGTPLLEEMIGKWILGAGPVFEFPTSTNDALGAQQYSVGPAVVVGYRAMRLFEVRQDVTELSMDVRGAVIRSSAEF